MKSLKAKTISVQADIEPAKLELQYILSAGLVIVVTGIVLSFGAQVQGETRADTCTDDGYVYNKSTGTCWSDSYENVSADGGYDFNISTKALEGNYNLTKKLPTIGTVVAIVVVIGLLIGGFAYLMK